jgi:uncharacterized protein (DUF927 family)
MLPTKHYVDRPKTKSAIALTKIILKISTFSIKKNMILQEKNNRLIEYVTRIIQSLSVCDFISDERKILPGIIRVRGYVAMFICKDLQT